MNNFKIDTISKNLWHWKCTKILEADIIGLDYFSDWPAIWPRGEGVLPYMGYIGMCRCEGYGFQAVYSRIGYINQSVWV